MDLPARASRWDEHGVVPRVSSRTLAEIARVEQRRYWRGATYRALCHWRWTVYQRGPWIIYVADDDASGCCDWVGYWRRTLEAVCLQLSPRARRELRAVIAPLDERFLARTLNDPFAARSDQWWQRRVGSP